MDKKEVKKKIGRNELHMKYTQESRRSGECGFHSLKKKGKKAKQERKRAKQDLREIIQEYNN